MQFDIGPGLACDLEALVSTRLLIQASSGQGKTWIIRRILEQTYGHIQHVVVDPEGEYHTLREKHDYIYAAAQGGDVVAHPKYAKDLAREILSLGVSVILDIFELNPDDRRVFVRDYLMAMIDAPKDLWHPALVVIDEAHLFCPEKGDATSAVAVEAMASRGRKRQFALVAATQRLSKFKKDAAAELANKLIGGTNLDLDIDRAGEELGFPKVERIGRLRTLNPGTFWAFGRAFRDLGGNVPKYPSQVSVGAVATSHGRVDGKAWTPTPPSDTVKAALARLASLPTDADGREQTVEELRARIAELESSIGEPVNVPVPIPYVPEPVVAALGEIALQSEELAAAVRALVDTVDRTPAPDTPIFGVDFGSGESWSAQGAAGGSVPDTRRRHSDAVDDGAGTKLPTRPRKTKATDEGEAATVDDGIQTDAQAKILATASELERRGLMSINATVNVERIARWLGIHPNGGRYRANIRTLVKRGRLNEVYWPLATAEATRERLYPRRGIAGLPIGDGMQAIVDVLPSAGHGRHNVETIAKDLGIHPNGGRFRGNLRLLVKMGIVTVEKGGYALSPGAFK